jgi:formylmethanofuran dehydrogenase subunit B
MTAPPATATPPAAWTCPFCALLCDGWAAPAVAAASCERARRHVQAWQTSQMPAPPSGAGSAAAIARAAQRLRPWRQPLFGGMATDVAGARALYRLAARTGAIVDHADGDALMRGLRAVQDRGQYIATLGELRARCHTLVCVGTDGVARHPRLFDRIGLGREGGPCRRLVFLGAMPPAGLPATVSVQHLPGSGVLLADVQQLAAWVARRPDARPAAAEPSLAGLADELHASPYAVLLWEGGVLPTHGALVVELLNRIAGTLNQTTRAATFGLGGSDGAASVSQAFTWLGGLPLRTRIGRDGLQHEPHRHATARLLADGAVDGLLWIASFDPGRLPPATALPRIVLGPPAMAAQLGPDDIHIPVAAPGYNSDAHLFRTDGPVLLPLAAARDDGLLTVAQVATALLQALGDEG